ncbi:MAG TPA: hypothetical protein VGG27_02105 [Magnetospirillaceae bacterium]|jgi:hypothetical protein
MSGWESVFGTEWAVTLAITVIFMGGCAFTTGQAIASTWRPSWHAVPYALLLGCGDRFVVYALFQGDLFLWSGYVIDTIWLFAVIAFAFRVTRARQMVTQYPWLYDRAGLLNWRAKS